MQASEFPRFINIKQRASLRTWTWPGVQCGCRHSSKSRAVRTASTCYCNLHLTKRAVSAQAWFAFYVLRGGGAGGGDGQERRPAPEGAPGAGLAGSMLKVPAADNRKNGFSTGSSKRQCQVGWLIVGHLGGV